MRRTQVGGGACILGAWPEAPLPCQPGGEGPTGTVNGQLPPRAASTPAWGLTCLQAGSRVGDCSHSQDTPRRVVRLTFPLDFEVWMGRGQGLLGGDRCSDPSLPCSGELSMS